MAAPVLTEEQRIQLLEWLAAGHAQPLIDMLFAARGWKPVTNGSLSFYREKHRAEIEARRKEREARAFDAGLAQWEARVQALVGLKWTPDDKGKLHNEKAWRETLDDIAREMGHRRTGIDLHTLFGRMTEEELDAYIASAEQVLTETGESVSAGAAARDTGVALTGVDAVP